MHKQVAGLVRGQRFDRQRDSTREVIADLVQEVRQVAPVATARSQRWDPAEVVRILLETEIKGRDEATRRNHRRLAQLPSGKTFDSWKEAESSMPVPTQHALMTLEWVSRAENLAVAGPGVIAGSIMI